MIEGAVCNSAKLEFLQGIHSVTDRYKIALYTEEATLGPETTQYSTANEIGDQGYQAGGKSLQSPKLRLIKDEVSMMFSTPIVWENASISARGALIYNASKENKALATFDFKKDIISTNGPFEVNIPNEGAIILS